MIGDSPKNCAFACLWRFGKLDVATISLSVARATASEFDGQFHHLIAAFSLRVVTIADQIPKPAPDVHSVRLLEPIPMAVENLDDTQPLVGNNRVYQRAAARVVGSRVSVDCRPRRRFLPRRGALPASLISPTASTIVGDACPDSRPGYVITGATVEPVFQSLAVQVETATDYAGGAVLLFQNGVERGARGIDHLYKPLVFIVTKIVQNQSA